MKCPSCAGLLIQTDLSSQGLVGVERCGQCAGAWLSKTALKSFQHGDEWESLDSMGAKAAEALSEIICPTCAVQTTKVRFEGHTEFEVDRCPSCHGLWLDRGELDAVHGAVLEYAEEHGTLEEKPQAWSTMHWVVYRLGQQWHPGHQGEGVV